MTESYVRWKAWDASSFGHFSVEEAAYFFEELRTSGVESVSGRLVGEIGYGNGPFAGWVTSQGGKWIGREISRELHDRAVSGGYSVLQSDESFAEGCGRGALELLVAFDVLEHLEVEAIRAFLDDASEALSSTGLLLLRMPSGDSPFSGAIYRGDLTHKSLLGSKAITWLLEEAHLHVEQIRPPVLPLGRAWTTRVRRAAVLITRSIVFTFVRSVLMGNDSAIISPNMCVVARRSPSVSERNPRASCHSR